MGLWKTVGSLARLILSVITLRFCALWSPLALKNVWKDLFLCQCSIDSAWSLCLKFLSQFLVDGPVCGIFGGHCETKQVAGTRRNAEKQKKIVIWEHITAYLISHQIYLRAPAQLEICCRSYSYLSYHLRVRVQWALCTDSSHLWGFCSKLTNTTSFTFTHSRVCHPQVRGNRYDWFDYIYILKGALCLSISG
jgi:hypothetical protein